MSSTDEEGRCSSRGQSNGEEEQQAEDVVFDESNGKDGFAIHSDAKNVRVQPSSQLSDSSPFHFNTIVDYTWETQWSHGRLIATHLSSMFIAYIVKVGNAGAVRVIDMESKERVLMKGEKGLIKDVDFLHKNEDIILGFIDEYGTFYINKIIKEHKTGKLTAHAVIKVTLDGSPLRHENRRFIWCKYLPDELNLANPRDCSYHYAVLQNDTIFAGNLIQLVQSQGEGPHLFHEIREEFLTIDTHSASVTDASFAPDGTALATCSKDGTVKFFQIYFQEKAPVRCLYSWAPHDGRPIDKIFFLDNHTLVKDNPSDSQYWKFMVTAADNCTELKLFTCRSWECLQTIKFNVPKTSQWKLELNLTARYLMATDIHQKSMYLMHLECQDMQARFDWIREFSMPWNTIGFNISSATTIKFVDAVSKGFGPSIMGDQGSYGKDDVLNLVEINVLQPRSMQQGSVAVMSPKVYFRSRSNGHRRISFNRSIDLREFEDADEPNAQENLQGTSISPIRNNLSTASPPVGHGTIRSSSFDVDRRSSPSSSNCNNAPTNSNRRSTMSLSPNNAPKEAPSAAEMSEQLSSLIGLSPGGGLGRVPFGGSGASSSVRTKSSSPQPQPTLPFVVGTDSQVINGSASKTSTSSSPSREVEEILSPKSTQNFAARHSAAGMETAVVMNAALNMESAFENGNIPGIPTLVQYSGSSPTKSKMDSVYHTHDYQIPQVLEKINSLTELITAQATQLRDLKHEVGRLTVMHETSKASSDAGLLLQVLDKHMSQTKTQFSRIEDVLLSIDNSEKHRSNQPAIPSNLAEVLAAQLGNIVKNELGLVIPQVMNQVFEPSRLNVTTQIDRLTNVVEAKLAQNIHQIMQRDRIWQTLTNNFQTITKTVFDSTFADLFMNSVFPRCQTAVQEMLTQVNETFRSGTREYLSGLEGVLERERRRDDFSELITQQMAAMQDALSSALQVEVESQMLGVLGGIQGGVVRQIEDCLSRELTRAFQDQQRYFEISVAPRTVTPAVSVCESLGGIPISDARANKRRVIDMAKNGDIRGAFTLASSLGDAEILMQLCKMYSAAVLAELNLSSSVLLSIMQLLASDILEDTEIKIDYLNMSIMSLDMTDPKNGKGVSRLIPVYQAAVSKFEDRNPNSNLLPRIKVLQMAFGKSPQLKAISSQSQSSIGHQLSHSFSQFPQ